MYRDEKAERSQRQVLDAALTLFSRRGFRATSMRDIATKARVSTGNVYHHFEDKDAIFRTLIDELWEIAESERFPFTRALAGGAFPGQLDRLAYAARDSVVEYRDYLTLIYVDVIEFKGEHIRRFYGELGQRFVQRLAPADADAMRAKLRSGLSLESALIRTSRILMTWFSVEVIFGVTEPNGGDMKASVQELTDLLRQGILD